MMSPPRVRFVRIKSPKCADNSMFEREVSIEITSGRARRCCLEYRRTRSSTCGCEFGFVTHTARGERKASTAQFK